MKRLVECVPNFSEGREFAVVEEIVRAIQSVEGIVVLDREMDRDHNRSVITFAGPPETAGEAAVRGVARAVELIDLNHHTGEHPRIGAADVVPFVPLEGVEMQECIELAHRTGEEIWRRCGVPVYFYEAAAKDPERVNLEKIRRGQFEGLREEVRTNPARRPDVGGPDLHPTAGATVVGARKFLIAYNINLATFDVSVAQRIAKKIRASSGGMPFVKAMGVELKGRNRAQVSMNLTDFEQTPAHVVFEAVRREAANEGTTIEGSEIIGLIPKKAVEMAAAHFLQVENFHPNLILENRLAQSRSRPTEGDENVGRPPWAAAGPPAGSRPLQELGRPGQGARRGPGGPPHTFKGAEGLRDFLDQLSAPIAVPGGGSASAAAAAMASALGMMVAGLIAKKKESEDLRPLIGRLREMRDFFEKAVWRDAAAYEAVREAYRMPKDQRATALEAALQGAAIVPLEVAEQIRSMMPILQSLRDLAPKTMHSDIDVADALATAALEGARANVEINLGEIRNADFRRQVERRLGLLAE